MADQQIVYASIDTSTIDGKLKLLSVIRGEALKSDKLMATPFLVQDLVIHRVTVNDQEVDRVVLVSPDGDLAAFVSEGILSCINQMREVLGDPPWKPPVRVKVVQVPTRSGFRTLNLVPVS